MDDEVQGSGASQQGSDPDARRGGWSLWRRFQDWRDAHPDIYEFIMFNIMSNVATITNFLVLFVSNAIIFSAWADTPFSWGPFEYTVAAGGLAGFLSFLLAYAAAQAVNFYVQRKVVFKANNNLGAAIPIYITAVVAVYFICLYVPQIIVPPLTDVVGGWAVYVANVVNIMIQVVILYPVLKFVVMRKVEQNEAAEAAAHEAEGSRTD
ncbi:hypothetical protein [Demequina sp. NBRC 110052]|uniref:hypothetical protein n=1 Tax=Demequina sp. NBRC 110052 TaxID=1570341 RepID=UPI00190EB49D|nr:hypothetical protein [Demequina sp. NBRC 110052]